MSSTLGYVITRTDHRAVEQFVGRLAELGHYDWLCIATSPLCMSDESRRACLVLEHLIAQHRLAVEVWNVGDDVETTVHLSLGSRGYAPSSEGASLRDARNAAKNAAVALLIRPLLTPHDFMALYGAFEQLIPAPLALGSRDPRLAGLPRPVLPRWSPVLHGA
jgi:hypothetical protein